MNLSRRIKTIGLLVILVNCDKVSTQFHLPSPVRSESYRSICFFVAEIRQQKDQMEAMVVQWRDYKDEYERLSDWLQQMDILVKAQKNALLATVQEKQKQVQDVKVSRVTVFSWIKLFSMIFENLALN